MIINIKTQSGKEYKLWQVDRNNFITFIDGQQNRTYRVEACSPVTIGGELVVVYYKTNNVGVFIGKQKFFSGEPIEDILINFD